MGNGPQLACRAQTDPEAGPGPKYAGTFFPAIEWWKVRRASEPGS
jgi:hypothetical protein